MGNSNSINHFPPYNDLIILFLLIAQSTIQLLELLSLHHPLLKIYKRYRKFIVKTFPAQLLQVSPKKAFEKVKIYPNKKNTIPSRTIPICTWTLNAPTSTIWDEPDYDKDISLWGECKVLQGKDSWSVHQLRKSDTGWSTDRTNSQGYWLLFQTFGQLLVFLAVMPS